MAFAPNRTDEKFLTLSVSKPRIPPQKSLTNLPAIAMLHAIIKINLNGKNSFMNQQPNKTPGALPDVFTITDIDTLKAVSTPFRQSLMRLMAEKPRTVKEMARELDIPPSRLYYHVNQLEKHGIIRVVSTQVVSGIIEKRYQISARTFRVDRALLAPGSEQECAAIEAMLQSTFEAAEEEIRRGLRTDVIDMSKAAPEPGATLIGHSIIRLTPQQYSDFLRKLADLYEEFEGASGNADDPEAILTGLLVAMYPTEPPTTEA